MKARTIGVILSTLAIAFASIVDVGSASADESALVAAIKSRGTLRAAVDAAPPNMMLNPTNNKWEGVFIDLMNAWAQELGVKVEYQQTAFGVMVAAIQSDRVDVGLDLTVNPERLKGAKFTIPVREDIGVFLLGPNNSNIKSLADLNKPEAKVCVQQGGAYDIALSQAGMKMEILRLPSHSACIAALDSGRVDGQFAGWVNAGAYAKTNRGARIIFTSQPLLKSAISNGLSLRYTDADLKPLNDFTRAWINKPDGLGASLKRWNGDVSPISYAIGEVPQYVKDAVPGTFGRD